MLSWEERYKIAVGIAEALDYLHSGGGSDEPVIHGDVKSSNILLSKDFEPQVNYYLFVSYFIIIYLCRFKYYHIEKYN